MFVGLLAHSFATIANFQWFSKLQSPLNGMVKGNHWDQWFSDGFQVRQPLVTMVFNGCAPSVQWWNGYVPSLKSSSSTWASYPLPVPFAISAFLSRSLSFFRISIILNLSSINAFFSSLGGWFEGIQKDFSISTSFRESFPFGLFVVRAEWNLQCKNCQNQNG